MNAFLSAIRVWFRVSSRRQVAQVVGGALVLFFLVFGVGGVVGHFVRPRVVVRTETRTEVKTVEVVKTVTVEKPVDRWRDRVVKVVEYRDGPISRTVETETKDGEHKGGSETTTTSRETSDAKTDTRTVTITNPAPRWSVRALAGVAGTGGVVAGAGVDYRLVGPLTAGAWLVAPVGMGPAPVAAGVSVGFTF